jgi:outer membrane DcaP-like protein
MTRNRLLAACAIFVASPVLAAPPAASAATQASAAATSGAAAQQGEARPLTDAERAQAIQELQDLQARMTALEQRLGVTPPPQVQYTPAAPRPPRDHNLELYGFTQLDAIQDFKRVDPNWEAALRPSKIPTTGGEFGSDGQSIFSVRQTRLGVKADGTVLGKPYEAKFEFDLFGTGADEGKTHMRIRHMYASWGPFLAGQTNTLFMDGDIAPNSIEYWGPPGMAWLRNPQIRWTFVDKNGFTAAVAIEHPSDDIDPGRLRLFDENIANNIQPDEKVPDLTAAIRYGGKWGHVRLAGLLRRVGYETRNVDEITNNQPRGHQTGWGIDATSAINFRPVTLKLGAVYGRGLATYMNDGGMDLAPAVAVTREDGIITIIPRAEAVKLFGMSAFVDVQWAKNWSSSIGYSFDKVDNTNFQDPSAFHKGEYALVNVLWTPADPVMTGLELQWGKRTDNDGNKGNDLRLQYSFKWSFSSKNIWDLVE